MTAALMIALNQLNTNINNLVQAIELGTQIILGGMAGLASGLILFYAIIKGL
jgi:hypothetical protein